jgi:hypothetical protein
MRAAGILLLLAIVPGLLVSCGGGKKSATGVETPAIPAVTTAAQSPSVEPGELVASPTIAEADTIGGVKARTLTAGAPVPLPAGYVFYEVQWAWEGPAEAVRRAYRDSSDAVRVDVLYQTRLVSPASGPPSGPAISSVAAAPDGSVIAIGVCQGFCYGETGPITVISSTDSGISWSEFGAAKPNSWVVGASAHEVLLGTQGGIDLLEPGGVQTHLVSTPPWQWDVLLVPGSPLPVLVRAVDGVTLNLPDGTVFARPSLPAGARVETFMRTPPGRWDREVNEIDWSTPERPTGSARIRYTGFVDFPTGAMKAVFRWDPALYVSQSPGLWLTTNQEIRGVNFPISLFGDRFADRPGGEVYLPAVVDFESGTVSPILEHFADNIRGAKSGSPVVLAVGRGPFARVNTGGDCLNVRTDPTEAARSLGCFKNGVLLRLVAAPKGQPVVVDGTTWIPVILPSDLIAGWASAEFLER